MNQAVKLNHIGIAVDDLGKAMEEYRRLGFEVSTPEAQPAQGVTVAFVTLENTRLELLEPLGADSPIRGFLDKRGPGLHHLALGVDDLPGCLAGLAAGGIPLIDRTPRPGAHGHSVAFAHPTATSSRVLLEFCTK